MASHEDATRRSVLLDDRIRQRTDVALRTWLEQYSSQLVYVPLDALMISQNAWNHVTQGHVTQGTVAPHMVFAHPRLLREHPSLSAYYRGIALLSQKRVSDLAASVANWELPGTRSRVSEAKSLEVSRLYNAVISSIIEGAGDWTIENGYRNIIANMGIGLDGTIRNVIGRDAERTIKDKIGHWLKRLNLITSFSIDQTIFELPSGYSMRFASEPDIEFRQTIEGMEKVVATVEIKGGKDPAGALERLGAIQKSFEATPPGCANILIAGVITDEMAVRLDQLGITKRYLLDDLTHDDSKWADFLNEVFHHTVRITDVPVTEEHLTF